MSKDKGSKNNKKAPADKLSGKGKVLSAYKSESKGGPANPALDAFTAKPESGKGGSQKP